MEGGGGLRGSALSYFLKFLLVLEKLASIWTGSLVAEI